MQHPFLLLFITFTTTVNANICSNYNYQQCTDAINRIPYGCGRDMCVDTSPCYWCITNSTAQCFGRDDCDPAITTNTTQECPRGYQASVNTMSCETSKTIQIVMFSFISLVPAFFYGYATRQYLHQFQNSPTCIDQIVTILSGISIFILFVCTLVKQGIVVWGFLFFPTIVIPLGVLLTRAILLRFCKY